MTDGFVEKIRRAQNTDHNTLYCNQSAKMELLNTDSLSGPTIRAADIEISGLNVVTHERFHQPIVCRKGEIFNLSEEFKCGEAESESI